jgi:hypothetical protein
MAAAILTSALLSACSLLPKTDGVVIDHPHGLDGIRDAFRITALQPEDHTPLVEQTLKQFRKSDPGHRLHGITYHLSKGNAPRIRCGVVTPLPKPSPRKRTWRKASLDPRMTAPSHAVAEYPR